MPTRSAPIAAAAAIPSAAAAADGRALRRLPPRLTFVRHSPGSRDAADRADDDAAGDDEPEVVPGRRDQLLDERPVALEPGPAAHVLECPLELVLRLAAEDVHPPAAEARLDHDRQPEVGQARRPGRRCSVRGCGIPARASRRAVTSLSCAATSAEAGLSTRTPRRSSQRSSSRPLSTPSRVGRTSSLPEHGVALAQPAVDLAGPERAPRRSRGRTTSG